MALSIIFFSEMLNPYAYQEHQPLTGFLSLDAGTRFHDFTFWGEKSHGLEIWSD
jgi:hypothetical protein